MGAVDCLCQKAPVDHEQIGYSGFAAGLKNNHLELAHIAASDRISRQTARESCGQGLIRQRIRRLAIWAVNALRGSFSLQIAECLAHLLPCLLKMFAQRRFRRIRVAQQNGIKDTLMRGKIRAVPLWQARHLRPMRL